MRTGEACSIVGAIVHQGKSGGNSPRGLLLVLLGRFLSSWRETWGHGVGVAPIRTACACWSWPWSVLVLVGVVRRRG